MGAAGACVCAWVRAVGVGWALGFGARLLTRSHAADGVREKSILLVKKNEGALTGQRGGETGTREKCASRTGQYARAMGWVFRGRCLISFRVRREVLVTERQAGGGWRVRTAHRTAHDTRHTARTADGLAQAGLRSQHDRRRNLRRDRTR